MTSSASAGIRSLLEGVGELTKAMSAKALRPKLLGQGGGG
jgi:hypothetical protein